MTGTEHDVLADGYCTTCETVPCRQPRTVAPSNNRGSTGQLDRIELKLNQLLRRAGIDPDRMRQ